MADHYAYIKARAPGAKRYAFLTPPGGLNHLRIHAARFVDMATAQRFIDANAPDNPGWDFKAVGAR